MLIPQHKRVKFSKHDYLQAFQVGKHEGYICRSLAELFDFVISLLHELDPVDGPKPRRDKASSHLSLEDNRRLRKKLHLTEDIETGVLHTERAWWFRGSNAEYPLTSGLFRYDMHGLSALKFSRPIEDYADLDRRLRHIYFTESRTNTADTSNVWDLVTEMQHYGLPTRLLDWTYQLSTAAFFAVYYAHHRKLAEEKLREGRPRQGKMNRVFSRTREQLRPRKEHGNASEDGDPTIWLLNPRVLSGVFLGEYAGNDYSYLEQYGVTSEWNKWDKVKLDEFLKVRHENPHWMYDCLAASSGHFPVFSALTNPRLQAQAGCFTLQGSQESIEALQQKYKNGPRFLLKVRLRLQVTEAWCQMQRIGVDYRYMFPEKEHIIKWMQEQRAADSRKEN